MIRYFRANTMHERLAQLVAPRHTVRLTPRSLLKSKDPDPRCRSIEGISILFSELEEDGKGFPVLLRQYLRLDSALLSFTLDTPFPMWWTV